MVAAVGGHTVFDWSQWDGWWPQWDGWMVAAVGERNSLPVTQSLTGVRVLSPQELAATALNLRIGWLALAVQANLLRPPTRKDPAIAAEHIAASTQEDMLAEGWPKRW